MSILDFMSVNRSSILLISFSSLKFLNSSFIVSLLYCIFSNELFILAISIFISFILDDTLSKPFIFSSVFVISIIKSFRPVDKVSIFSLVVLHFLLLKFLSIGCVQVGQVSFFSKKSNVFL